MFLTLPVQLVGLPVTPYQIAIFAPAALGLGCWIFMVFIGLGCIFVSYIRYTYKPIPNSSQLSKLKAPGVSILRPLKGVDVNLVDNLTSSFRLRYPNYEILFSVAEGSDPSVNVVRDLMAQFPEVDARLIIGESNVGVNPKVNNLITSYTTCKNEIVWILDSNVHVTPDTLGRAVDMLFSNPRIGLVHHIPIGMKPESFGATVEQLYLNTSHAKVYTMINKLSLGSCVIGKSNLFRKSELSHVGGLAYFGKFMSEDNIIGQTVWSRNRCHAIPADIVYQKLGDGGIKEYFSRRARWTRIRKFTVLFATMIEPLMECMLNGLLGAYGFWTFWKVDPAYFFMAHVVYWFSLDVMFGFAVEKSMVVDNFPRFVLAWLVRELTAFPVLLYACAGSRVEWRGKSFKLKSDGTVVPHSMEKCSDGTEDGASAVVVDSIGKVLCSSNITFGGKVLGVGAVLVAVFLFAGAVFAESLKGILGIGQPIDTQAAITGEIGNSQTIIGPVVTKSAISNPILNPSVQMKRRSARVAAAAERESPMKTQQSSCMDAKFAALLENDDSQDELPPLPQKHSLASTQLKRTPLWELTASYISGCNFPTPPSASEAWKIMFGSLTDKISGQHHHEGVKGM